MAPTCRPPAPWALAADLVARGPRPRVPRTACLGPRPRHPHRVAALPPGRIVRGRRAGAPVRCGRCPTIHCHLARRPAPARSGPLRPACRRVAVVGRPSRHSSSVLRAAPANPVRDVPTIPGGGVARSPRPQAPRAHCWRPGPLWSVPDHPLPAGSLARSGPRPAGWQTPSVRVVAPPTGLRAAPASPVCDVPTIPAGMSLGVRDLRPASRSPGGSPPGSSF